MKILDVSVQKSDKGRVFSASCLAYVLCGNLQPGSGNTDRPIWAVYAGTETELRPFLANLKLGKKIKIGRENHEFLKSLKYQISFQRMVEGSVATVFLPEMFRLDPGMVETDRIEFVLLPPQERLDRISAEVDFQAIHAYAETLGHDLEEDKLKLLVPTAHLFGAYLDRRTRCPLVADGRFYVQLLLACLKEGIASFSRDTKGYYYRYDTWGHHPRGFVGMNLEQVGIPFGILASSTHEAFEALLADQVKEYFQRVS